jgi:hypothetical protein
MWAALAFRTQNFFVAALKSIISCWSGAASMD